MNVYYLVEKLKHSFNYLFTDLIAFPNCNVQIGLENQCLRYIVVYFGFGT